MMITIPEVEESAKIWIDLIVVGCSVEFERVEVGPGEVVVFGDVAPPVEGVE